MNLLGRLFIVLIFVGSIMLMSWSVVLFATHTNWRAQATKLDADLKQKTQDLAALQKEMADMKTALDLEIKNQANRSVGLADRVRQLTQDNDTARADLATKEVQLKEQTALADAAVKETEQLRIRLDETSKALFLAQSEWADMATKLARKMDEAHSLAIQVADYQSVGAQLAKDYRDAVEVLRSQGITTADLALFGSKPPAGIRGTVTEVRPGGMIEISIGSDSGITKGHHLDIVRERGGRSSYIGKIEVTSVVADRAVARVMPEFRKGVVQREDEVTYIDVNEFVAH